MVTPNISKASREVLFPMFCTRILDMDSVLSPQLSLGQSELTDSSAASLCEGNLNKINIFRFESYEFILYLDPSCLVLKDVSSLLEKGKHIDRSTTFIAAAPNTLNPNTFDSGVLVIRPSQDVYRNLLEHVKSPIHPLETGVAEVLNNYFSNWCTAMPSSNHIGPEFNIQRTSNLELSVEPDLIHIIQFSTCPKPWESKERRAPISTGSFGKTSWESLEYQWWSWYRKSQNYRRKAMQNEAEQKASLIRKTQKSKTSISASNTKSNLGKHKEVSLRYKELRKQGLEAKEAMCQARRDCNAEESPNPGAAVAAMFGIQ
jgi:hypothetical protein